MLLLSTYCIFLDGMYTNRKGLGKQISSCSTHGARYVPLCTLIVDIWAILISLVLLRWLQLSTYWNIWLHKNSNLSIIHFQERQGLVSIVDLLSIWNPSWKHEWPFCMCSYRRLMATIVNHWLLLSTTYGHAIVDLRPRLWTTDPSYCRLIDMLSSTYWHANI